MLIIKHKAMPRHDLLFLVHFFLVLFLASPSLPLPAPPSPPLLAPISKDHSTLLYSLPLYLKTPLVPTKLHLDLGSSYSWLDCTKNYSSSTYRHVPCDSSFCDSFMSYTCNYCYQPLGPTCFNNSCGLYPENPVTGAVLADSALIDALALPTTDGSTPGPLALIPEFVFSCSKSSLLKGLAKKVGGLVALGRSNHSLPAQVSTSFSLPRYFALCLSGSFRAPGVGLFGTRGPYHFTGSKNGDLSKHLIYTPLVLNPVTSTIVIYGASDEYFVGLTSIKVNGKIVPLNKTLLGIDPEHGNGGTRLSTSAPYTVMETSIYKAFVNLFVKESSTHYNLTRTVAVRPYDACYLAKDVVNTQVGPKVPTVDLVMGTDGVVWRIFGSNSMVRISNKKRDVWCLGFVDAGPKPRPRSRSSIVIGGHQMEDNLLQFDLESMRLGFSSSLLLQGTKCSNFNFTTHKHM